MSFITNTLNVVRTSLQIILSNKVVPRRTISYTSTHFAKEDASNTTSVEVREILKDRSVTIPVETSIRYLESNAYKETYGNDPVWKLYKRNFKGRFPRPKTRRMCIRGDVVSTGNPCPICRDEYLILDYRNTKLLKQFISPYTGEILSYQQTNICQKQHRNLLVALHKAKDCGNVTFDLPFRVYDYSEYNPNIKT